MVSTIAYRPNVEHVSCLCDEHVSCLFLDFYCDEDVTPDAPDIDEETFLMVKILKTFRQYIVFHESTTLLMISDNFLILFVQFRFMSKKVTSCLG